MKTRVTTVIIMLIIALIYCTSIILSQEKQIEELTKSVMLQDKIIAQQSIIEDRQEELILIAQYIIENETRSTDEIKTYLKAFNDWIEGR